MFYVGQKVCAVADPKDGHEWFIHPKFRYLGIEEPVVGAVYTVRFIGRTVFDQLDYVLVHEIRNAQLPFAEEGQTEPGFPLFRFRPVVEREYDISIFRAMLNPSDKRVDA